MGVVLNLLSKSAATSLEEDAIGSRFPLLQNYVAMGQSDVPAEKIYDLWEELKRMQIAFLDGSLKLASQTVEIVVPIHETGYIQDFGMPVKKDSREIIGHTLNANLDQCELAMLCKCGLGKFSSVPAVIKGAIKILKLKPVDLIAILPSTRTWQVSIVSFNSNNNPDSGSFADGLHVPFRVWGLIAINGEELAFKATMHYGTNQWEVNSLGPIHFAEGWKNWLEMPSFIQAFKTLSGQPFRADGPWAFNPELAEELKASPHFQQALNRVCSRWLI